MARFLPFTWTVLNDRLNRLVNLTSNRRVFMPCNNITHIGKITLPTSYTYKVKISQ